MSAAAPGANRRFDDADRRAMGRALTLARRGRSTTAPNPMVGSVVVRAGEVVGEGWHRRAGGEHAEAMALGQAGGRARGGTIYVTLEPCNHDGRTPPCAERILESGVRRVVFAHRDPNPEVTGGGAARLREAGLRVESGLLADQAVELNVPFLTRVLHGRPAVTLKWAMSLDGRIATATGDSQWISSEQGRRWALELREEHQAIVVGSGTALADDPRLDRRLGRAEGPIVRVVLDRRLRLPAGARMFEIEGPVVIYTEAPREIGSSTSADTRDWATRRDQLRSAGAEVVGLPAVEPAGVLEDLFDRGVSNVLVEGGGQVLAAFSGSGLWDRAAVCCAPVLIGGAAAPGPLGGEGPLRLADAWRLDELRVGRRGPDVILLGYRQGCLPELSRNVGG
ncbi:MAG: bifunctional diaminohydroxyphosphoribosylaminopyrimidine deaminase/5-amino-6-(5-phosphoribosylamino)uracil reductase RibD [Acidobacteria bacterium]|nr:bifunctional diaminohydroxyphosphoribosylaminopyrimidine deaminase/5-amino-6-(5-phosphoribosylamino)uracil reductase RibD [Acidobacteriota bacterium]